MAPTKVGALRKKEWKKVRWPGHFSAFDEDPVKAADLATDEFSDYIMHFRSMNTTVETIYVLDAIEQYTVVTLYDPFKSKFFYSISVVFSVLRKDIPQDQDQGQNQDQKEGLLAYAG